MHLISFIKIFTAGITVLFGFICGIVEIRKNPRYWLNRFFALFFMTSSLGFFFYTLYHIILSNADLVIPFMITAQICFQLAMSFLLLTEFTLEYSQKIVLSPKYLLIALFLFIGSSMGYFIWNPTLDQESYIEGFVDTHTPIGWFIFVFLYRIIIMGYVLIKFFVIGKKSEGKIKKQMYFFSSGMGINILATIITLLGGIEGFFGIALEIFGMLLFNLGVIAVLKGFLLKE